MRRWVRSSSSSRRSSEFTLPPWSLWCSRVSLSLNGGLPSMPQPSVSARDRSSRRSRTRRHHWSTHSCRSTKSLASRSSGASASNSPGDIPQFVNSTRSPSIVATCATGSPLESVAQISRPLRSTIVVTCVRHVRYTSMRWGWRGSSGTNVYSVSGYWIRRTGSAERPGRARWIAPGWANKPGKTRTGDARHACGDALIRRAAWVPTAVITPRPRSTSTSAAMMATAGATMSLRSFQYPDVFQRRRDGRRVWSHARAAAAISRCWPRRASDRSARSIAPAAGVPCPSLGRPRAYPRRVRRGS